MRGGGLLGSSQGRWQKCASIKRGQPKSSPACKRTSVDLGEGWARKVATQALLEKESHSSLTHTSSLSLLEPK